MKRTNACLAAVLAVSVAAFGQEQKEERVEAKIVAPRGVIQVVGPDADLEDIEVDDALPGFGSFILGVQGAPQDDGEKGGRKQDADKDGTIVREFDLPGGGHVKVVISRESLKGEGRHGIWIEGLKDQQARAFLVNPEGLQRAPRIEAREFRFATPERLRLLDPHGFDVERFRGEMREHVERALQAFDHARDEFLRACREAVPHGAWTREEGGAKDAPRPRERRPMVTRQEAPKVLIERQPAAREKAERAPKSEEAPDTTRKPRTRDVQVLGIAPGAAAKQAREIDELRKQIKELERMIREMKESTQKKADKPEKGE